MNPSIYTINNDPFSLRFLMALFIFAFLGLTQVSVGQTTIVQQDFDGSSSTKPPTWDYQSNVNFFSHKSNKNNVYPNEDGWDEDGFYGVVSNSSWSNNLTLSNFSKKILGINDLDDEDDFGTENTAKVTFEKINVSGYNSVDISFDYKLKNFGGDFIKYEVFEDGNGQGLKSLSGSGPETVSISNTSKTVKLVFRIKQNGQTEYAGIDNITLKGTAKTQSEPANQPSNFTANALSNGKIELTWTDASAGSQTQAPDGYLIKATDPGSSPSKPSDGTDPSIDKDLSDGSAVVKVGDGTGGSYTFSGLSRDTKYDFQIWSFTNAEGSIDFLTSPAGPSASASTLVNETIRTESFETNSGYTFPDGSGLSGQDVFDQVDLVAYDATKDFLYSGFDQDHFIAAEDIDGTLSNSDGIVKISNIDIKNYQDLKVKAALAAGANSGYEDGDGIEVEVKVDNGSWTRIADFKGETNGSNLQEDTNFDGTGDGKVLDGNFEDFMWDINQSGNQLSLRITVDLGAADEEAAFDHIRLTGRPPKKWDGGGTSGSDWSSANNWDPNGVPTNEDLVVLDDTHLSSDYTVNLDPNLTNNTVEQLKILPSSSQKIDVVRSSNLGTFKLSANNTALEIGDGGTFEDNTNDGLPGNFKNGNGEILVKDGGTYRASNNNGQFNSEDLVDAIASGSSQNGEVVLKGAGQSISVSGKTYPTSFTLKRNSNASSSSITYTVSGGNAFTVEGEFTVGSNVTYKGDPNASTPRSGNLIVKGDLTVNGTLNLNSGVQTLKLQGGNQQTVDGVTDLDQLTIDDPNGVKLENTLTISGTLTLTNGVVSFNSGTSDQVVIESGAAVSGASASSYVAGPVKKKGSSDFKFPVGKSGQYAPIEVTNFSNSSDFTAEYFKSKSGNFVSSSKLNANNLNNLSQNEYWTLDRSNTGSNAAKPEVTLYWESGMNHGISNLSDLRVARYDGTQWVDEGNTSNSGNSTSGSVTSGTVTSFSDFTFSSTSSNNTLPVELNSFTAQADQDVAVLNWSTASETNNRHFLIQRRAGDQWQEIGQVEGNGTTTVPQDYRFTDNNPQRGNNYYRLKQVDFDGSYEYSDVKVVAINENQQADEIHLSSYPNPVADQLNLELAGGEGAAYTVVIRTSRGQVVYRDQLTLSDDNGGQALPVSNLEPGTYVLMLRGAHKTHHKRFIKQ